MRQFGFFRFPKNPVFASLWLLNSPKQTHPSAKTLKHSYFCVGTKFRLVWVPERKAETLKKNPNNGTKNTRPKRPQKTSLETPPKTPKSTPGPTTPGLRTGPPRTRDGAIPIKPYKIRGLGLTPGLWMAHPEPEVGVRMAPSPVQGGPGSLCLAFCHARANGKLQV